MNTFLEHAIGLGLDQVEARNSALKRAANAYDTGLVPFYICGFEYLREPDADKFMCLRAEFLSPTGANPVVSEPATICQIEETCVDAHNPFQMYYALNQVARDNHSKLKRLRKDRRFQRECSDQVWRHESKRLLRLVRNYWKDLNHLGIAGVTKRRRNDIVVSTFHVVSGPGVATIGETDAACDRTLQLPR